MKYECQIVHKRNNEILIRINNCLSLHGKIYDSNEKAIGRITRILGPVSNPYALAYLASVDYSPEKVYVKC
ncbi:MULTISPECIES: H/ACA ribonucleoprotein complex subunit GAR1 [Acidiplasma]|jgi:RNA-binding protein|uniref:H/ACA RNA-protein complex protein Gar1 n=1 Tax=Acidiplasma cupricumulans TaxID=312540 RepID=A0A0Q0RV51_9ARCH|nr:MULTISPECIES: hypothetical protein [Acidiplasma]KJE49677.1 hypothetical protein TZ01_00750 [Acidiplasma sp. MBA-1]KQB33845.1 hypothetical protein AOG55_01855 [Acidiplasma cupricumulans]WMT55759.1 MAG: hypothetical protein RE470_03705 [Acidiplasma sp.]